MSEREHGSEKLQLSDDVTCQCVEPPTPADRGGSDCSVSPTMTYNSYEMSGCTHPKPLERKKKIMIKACTCYLIQRETILEFSK